MLRIPLRSASVTLKSTSTHHQSMKGIFQEHTTMATSRKSTQQISQTSSSWWVASLVKHFQSEASDVASRIPEGRSSLTLREYCKLRPHDYLYSRMSKDCLVTTVEQLSKPSSLQLMSWGMTVNGKCLTAAITESHRAGNASSLSDILEEHPDPKYFLSDHNLAMIAKSEALYRSTVRTTPRTESMM